MNQLAVILSSITGTLVIIVVASQLWKVWSKASAALKVLPEIRDAAVVLSGGIDKYLSQQEQMRISGDGLKSVPELLAGQVKMCAAQVEAINGLRKSVESFKQAVFKRDDIHSFEHPSEEQKSIAWDAKRIMNENPGMDYLTAITRAAEEEMKEMNGATTGGAEFSL